MNWKQAFALGLCSVGAYEQKSEWEVLFDRTVTTADGSSNGAFYGLELSDFSNIPVVSENDTIRLTVDGVATILPVFDWYKSYPGFYKWEVGNDWLTAGADNTGDTGYDYYFGFYSDLDSNGDYTAARYAFRSRNPGTYTVKVECKL